MKFVNWLEQNEVKKLKVVDTDNLTEEDQYKLGNSAIAKNGYIMGVHVTDNPQKVAEALRSGKKLIGTYGGGKGRSNEMGPGLYITSAPQIWMGRSTDRMDFLFKLMPDEKQRLANAILSNDNLTGKNRGYLSTNEINYAKRDIANFVNNSNPESGYHIVHLSGQPYNIDFWKPEFLQKIGIRSSKQPEQVEVYVKGKFVDIDNNYGHLNRWRPYMMQGYDGAFIKHEMQLVVWRNEAILKFGEYYSA